MAHMFPYGLTLDPYIQLFVSPFRGTILTISSFSAARPIRWHTFSVGMATASVQPNLPGFAPHNLPVMEARRNVGGMVSENMVSSLTILGCKVKILCNLLLFTLHALIAELVAPAR